MKRAMMGTSSMRTHALPRVWKPAAVMELCASMQVRVMMALSYVTTGTVLTTMAVETAALLPGAVTASRAAI